jgi:cytochrome b-561 domain-containing protein 2
MSPGRLSAKRINLSKLMHVLVILTSLSIAFTVFDGSLFAWHPLCMSIGYLLFMAEGLMSALGFRALDGPDRVAGIQSHALLQMRASLAIAIGFGVIFKNKVGPRAHG